MKHKGVIENYREYLPVNDETPVVTLLEGNTPLIPALHLSKLLGDGFEVYLKYEGLNPTGVLGSRRDHRDSRKRPYLQDYRKDHIRFYVQRERCFCSEFPRGFWHSSDRAGGFGVAAQETDFLYTSCDIG